jgi:hypothetical protein
VCSGPFVLQLLLHPAALLVAAAHLLCTHVGCERAAPQLLQVVYQQQRTVHLLALISCSPALLLLLLSSAWLLLLPAAVSFVLRCKCYYTAAVGWAASCWYSLPLSALFCSMLYSTVQQQ